MTAPRTSKLGVSIATVGIVALAAAAYMMFRESQVNETARDRAATDGVARRGRSAHTLSLSEEGALHGQVRFGDGKVCAGASVEISKTSTDDGRLPMVVGTATADAAGEFAVERLSAGSYFVTASDAASGDSGSIELELLSGERLSGVVVTVASRANTITGTVRDAGGGPIAGAALRGISISGVPLSLATSDDDGRYELQLDATANRIAAAADGYVSVAKHVHPARGEAVDFALHPASSVSGRVLEGGHPVAAATVWMWARDKRQTETNSDGVFHFDDVGPGRYQLEARRGAAVGTSVMPVHIGIASTIDDLTIELQVGRTFTGRVVDSSGGGVANASIQLRAASDGRRPGQTTATDEQGRFRLDAIAPGSYVASVTSAEHAALHERVDLVQGDATDLELVMQSAAKLCGQALAADGQAAMGALIVARDEARASHRTRTDDEGAFCLVGLPPGDVAIEASHDVHGFVSVDNVTTNGSDERLVELRFGRPSSLSGHVRWEDGTAASGVTVTARISGRGDLATRTDTEGKFRFAAVGAGQATVMAAREHHAWFVGSPSGPHQWACTVSEGLDVTAIELRLRRADMIIAGHVVDVEQAPVAGATVAVRVGMAQQRYFTLDDGSFVLEGLERGAYDVVVEHGDYATTKLANIAAGSDDVAVTLARSASVEGKVVDEHGAPVPAYKLAVMPTHATASYRHFDVTSGTGAFAVGGLAADRYSLVVTTMDGRCGRLADVEVSSGEHAGNLRIAIDDGVVLRGRVVDAADGMPLSGGSVSVFGVPPHPIDGSVDADGSFAITGIPTGIQVTLVASAPSHAAAAPTIPRQSSAGVIELGDLRLERTEQAAR